MKKNFFSRIAAIISLTLMVSVSYSQKQSISPFNNKMNLTAPDSVLSVPAGLIYSSNLGTLNAKVLKNFTRHFQNPDDVRITRQGNHTFIYCKTDGVTNRIRYNGKGNWYATIRSYAEDLLPKEIRKQVRSSYYDFDICGITEVLLGNKMAYLISIRNTETWKMVKILDDDMSVVESYQVK